MEPSAASPLDRNSYPMRLWKKAKAHGVWNPDDIEFARDRQDWLSLSVAKKECVLRLCALFLAGEKAVVLDLLPLISVVASERRLDEEIYLTSFLWEEAKHVDLFSRFLEEVVGDIGDLSRYHYPGFVRVFEEELRRSLRLLESDPSPEAQVRASVTYNIVIEGIIAESGYYLFHRILSVGDILPGIRRAVVLLHRDESRHIAFGVYFLRRLIVEHGDRAYKAFLDRLIELKPIVEESTEQFVQLFAGGHGFGVAASELIQYSRSRFAGRVQRIVRARTETLEDLRATCDIDSPEP